MGIDTALHRGVANFVRLLTDELKSAAAVESKYLSFLSHDLRNNLNTVTLTLDMLARQLTKTPHLNQEAKDVEALRQAVFETVEGMDRLLAAERLRKHVITVRLGPVDLHRLAADLLARISHKAVAKGLRLENGVPIGAAAHSDRELLTLVLQNLLGNAVKFSSGGTVRIAATRDQLGWRVFVSDQGPGIAPQHIHTLFEAFSRGETHGQPGVGLGLNIASHAARLLGSELSVQSQLGQGATFSFVVPESRPEIAQ
jgi:signal transduction histidine kinase